MWAGSGREFAAGTFNYLDWLAGWVSSVSPRQQIHHGAIVSEPALHELVAYVKSHGASEAARHFKMGYSIVRRRVRSAGVVLHRGQRRDISLAARNAEIRVLRMQGHFLIDIGEAFDLGRERIRQILATTGGDPLQGGEALPLPDDLKSGVMAATNPAMSAVTPTPASVPAQLEPAHQA